jgi:hypothetical protein
MSEQLKVIRPFEELSRLMQRRCEAIQQSEVKTQSLKKAAGEVLLEMRDRIEAGELGDLCNWREWFEANVRVISLRTAYEYMQIAGAEDPVAKETELRQRNREAQRAGRERLKLVPFVHDVMHKNSPIKSMEADKPPVRITPPPKSKYPMAPGDDALVAQIVDIFKRMSWDARVRVMKELGELYKRWHRGEE